MLLNVDIRTPANDIRARPNDWDRLRVKWPWSVKRWIELPSFQHSMCQWLLSQLRASKNNHSLNGYRKTYEQFQCLLPSVSSSNSMQNVFQLVQNPSKERINKPLLSHPTRLMLSIANSMMSRVIRSFDWSVDALTLKSASNSMRNGSVILPINALWLRQLQYIHTYILLTPQCLHHWHGTKTIIVRTIMSA